MVSNACNSKSNAFLVQCVWICYVAMCETTNNNEYTDICIHTTFWSPKLS